MYTYIQYNSVERNIGNTLGATEIHHSIETQKIESGIALYYWWKSVLTSTHCVFAFILEKLLYSRLYQSGNIGKISGATFKFDVNKRVGSISWWVLMYW